jgi:hypothetical protein
MNVTASPKASVTRSTPRLNHAKKPLSRGGACFSISAHIAGVSVSAMKPDTVTDTTIVTANCL